MTHTPGPWKASFGDLIRVFATELPGVTVCGVHKIGRQVGEYTPEAEVQCKANARLIAAAPDMLAALKLAEEHLPFIADDNPEASHALVQVRAAVAKAEGRTPSLTQPLEPDAS